MTDGRQLPPQPADEDFYRVRIPIEVFGVDVLVQFRLRDDAPAVVHQIREHAELVARELHGIAVDGE